VPNYNNLVRASPILKGQSVTKVVDLTKNCVLAGYGLLSVVCGSNFEIISLELLDQEILSNWII